MTEVVPAAFAWPSNAALIADVARLGYIGGHVLDCTYGLGNFWTLYKPELFTGSDLDPDKSPVGYTVDFTAMPFRGRTFDTVFFDPPYKLNGTSSSSSDQAYGVHEKASWRDRHKLIRGGIWECARVLAPNGHLLLKCQDQVCGGKVRWQTIEFAGYAAHAGLVLVDRFDMLDTSRPQPKTRRVCAACAYRRRKAETVCARCGTVEVAVVPILQEHAHGRPSTLLVFRKGAR